MICAVITSSFSFLTHICVSKNGEVGVCILVILVFCWMLFVYRTSFIKCVVQRICANRNTAWIELRCVRRCLTSIQQTGLKGIAYQTCEERVCCASFTEQSRPLHLKSSVKHLEIVCGFVHFTFPNISGTDESAKRTRRDERAHCWIRFYLNTSFDVWEFGMIVPCFFSLSLAEYRGKLNEICKRTVLC